MQFSLVLPAPKGRTTIRSEGRTNERKTAENLKSTTEWILSTLISLISLILWYFLYYCYYHSRSWGALYQARYISRKSHKICTAAIQWLLQYTNCIMQRTRACICETWERKWFFYRFWLPFLLFSPYFFNMAANV